MSDFRIQLEHGLESVVVEDACSRCSERGLPKAMTLAGVAVAFLLILNPHAIGAELAPAGEAVSTMGPRFLTPPMGFSSWNFGGGSYPRASNAMAVADAMVARGLRDAGYVYLMAFDGWWWTEKGGQRGDHGQIIPDADRWPQGIKFVCDYIHSKGLKVAGYGDIGRDGYGDSTGQQRGSYSHYESDAAQYAAWGWDYLKIDDCNHGGLPSREKGFAWFCDAVRNNPAGRQIYLSLSTPSTPSSAEFGRRVANMWRTSNDICVPGRASFQWATDLNFDSSEEFWWNQAPGVWNDIDMMVVGLPGISEVQNKTLFNLWAIRGAPLLIGCDLVTAPQSVIDILTNSEVIAVDQDPLCAQGRKVREDLPNVQVFCKPLGSFTGGDCAVLLVNRSDRPQDIRVYWSDLGFGNDACQVRNLNKHTDLGTLRESFTAPQVAPGDSLLLKVSGGVFDWSKPRNYEAESARNTLAGTVRHHAYRAGFSSFGSVDGIGRGLENYLQFNHVTAPHAGKYRVVVHYASGGVSEVLNNDDPRMSFSSEWGDWKEGGYYHDDTRETTSVDAWCNGKFTGDAVAWICKTCDNRGIADVFIDGARAATVDCYSPSAVSQVEVFSKSGLSEGPHTIRIVATGRKNPKSTDCMIDVDALRATASANEPLMARLTVNGQETSPLQFPATGGDTRVGSIETTVRLKPGDNAIRLFHNESPVPVIDRITLLDQAAPTINSVSFIRADSQTRGDWKGHYGSEAFSVFGHSASVPAEISLRFRAGGWRYYFPCDSHGLTLQTFADTTQDGRALLRPESAGGRIAAAVERPGDFTVTVEARDGKPHQAAFYVADWDRLSRRMTVEVYDGEANTLIDQRTVDDFMEGRYLVYRITGSIKVRFKCDAGPSAILQGIFLDRG